MLGNTLLFSGIEGIGRFLFAKALGIKLMYPDQIDPVDIVKRIDKGSHPDFCVLKPEGKVFLHSIDSVRGLIEKNSMAPFEAAAKIFVIEDEAIATKNIVLTRLKFV